MGGAQEGYVTTVIPWMWDFRLTRVREVSYYHLSPEIPPLSDEKRNGRIHLQAVGGNGTNCA